MLLAIAASFALGTALDKTGAAKMIADSTTALAGGNAWLALAIDLSRSRWSSPS